MNFLKKSWKIIVWIVVVIFIFFLLLKASTLLMGPFWFYFLLMIGWLVIAGIISIPFVILIRRSAWPKKTDLQEQEKVKLLSKNRKLFQLAIIIGIVGLVIYTILISIDRF